MALYVTRPRRDEERIGRGLPSADVVYGIYRGLPSELRRARRSFTETAECLVETTRYEVKSL